MNVAKGLAVTEVQGGESVGSDAWIDEDRCTGCGDCMKISPRLFVFNERRKAVIGDPESGTAAEIVWAAEQCPARAIHPGQPQHSSERHLDDVDFDPVKKRGLLRTDGLSSDIRRLRELPSKDWNQK